jgi:hypothetical protein
MTAVETPVPLRATVPTPTVLLMVRLPEAPRVTGVYVRVALIELPGATTAPADRPDTANGAATVKELTVSGLAPEFPTVTVRAALLPTAT